MYKKTHVVFFIFHFEQLSFFPNECPGLCRLSEKDKVARNEKRKKLHGFSYYKNIANFEAFWQDKNFNKNLLFLGSVKCLSTPSYLSSLFKMICQIYISWKNCFPVADDRCLFILEDKSSVNTMSV